MDQEPSKDGEGERMKYRFLAGTLNSGKKSYRAHKTGAAAGSSIPGLGHLHSALDLLKPLCGKLASWGFPPILFTTDVSNFADLGI